MSLFRSGQAPFLLEPNDPGWFPDIDLAMQEPNGLLAVGGDLSTSRLLTAYSQGIFPWFSEGQPILWWSPNPRAAFIPGQVKISRSLRKTLRRQEYTVTMDSAFADVIRCCAGMRRNANGTWITDTMRDAYIQLHTLGYAHSVECWFDNMLVGGLYGVSLGRMFFGESMFSHRTDASKVALLYLSNQLQHWKFSLIDSQVESPHIMSLGAQLLPRHEFRAILEASRTYDTRAGQWKFDAVVIQEMMDL